MIKWVIFSQFSFLIHNITHAGKKRLIQSSICLKCLAYLVLFLCNMSAPSQVTFDFLTGLVKSVQLSALKTRVVRLWYAWRRKSEFDSPPFRKTHTRLAVKKTDFDGRCVLRQSTADLALDVSPDFSLFPPSDHWPLAKHKSVEQIEVYLLISHGWIFIN